ncbi:MAG TPA: flagellar hook-associated protein FlgK [Nitrospirae bacterium]|nr:flagellar hook-associated protein 1 [bacterium BMS3Abin06]HDH13240.1 flagellar hook-associated protein FlgK [Nitrospirota bacterium]HDZ01792.1 flagellar hook-associated protein FlgK [Nitrospirota bacterium]
MSIMGLFDIGRSGIFANQLALRVTSNNIANVNTPGYSRQDAIMKVASPVELNGKHLGRGVGDVEIRRSFDSFVFLQILGQRTSYGSAYSLESGLSQVEQIFNEVQGFGLSGFMEEYFNAWQDLATNPEESAQRSTLLTKAQAFVNAAKQIESDLVRNVKFVNDEIGDTVDQINVITKNIATINGKIIGIEAGGAETANVFRDDREELMKNLSELVDYDWSEASDGSVTIVAGRRSIVAGITSYDLSTSINLEGDRDVYNGGVKATSFFQSGQLGGLISLRDNIKTNPLFSLRKLTASITKETNVLHYAGYGLDSSTNNDFFSPLELYTMKSVSGTSSTADITLATIPVATRSSLTLDEYDINLTTATAYEVVNRQTGATVTTGTYNPSGTTITFEGIQVAISGTAVANDSFFISPLQNAVQNFSVSVTDNQTIAASSSLTTLPGDNTNALNIINKNGSKISDLNSSTFNDYYAGIVSTVGSLSQAASDSLSFEENLLFELNNRRESVSGVSLDEEAANLIRFQRAFEAGARIIKLTDELLETIINL